MPNSAIDRYGLYLTEIKDIQNISIAKIIKNGVNVQFFLFIKHLLSVN